MSLLCCGASVVGWECGWGDSGYICYKVQCIHMAGIHYRQSFVVLGQHLKHSLRRVLLEGLKLLVGNDIDQEVKNLGVVDTGVDVALLEGSTLAI